MKAKLEEKGYKVDLQYANNDIATQVSQIENMVTKGEKILVIASIDGSALKNVLDAAKKKKVQVISYDRLVMNTNAVSYYATFDNYKVGALQGNFLVEKLGLKNRTKDNPAYIELFSSSPDDNNTNFFFAGTIDALKPYMDKGVLIVPSGQTAKNQCTTLNCSTEEAQKRMENLISAQGYGPNGKRLDAVHSVNDSVALGLINALTAAGYTKDNFPLITGQDCDKPNIKSIIKGTQSMSVFKDTRTLADKVVGMVDALMEGKKPEINDTKTYNNGMGIVPSYLCDPVFVTADNYKELLIDSGYYSMADLQ